MRKEDGGRDEEDDDDDDGGDDDVDERSERFISGGKGTISWGKRTISRRVLGVNPRDKAVSYSGVRSSIHPYGTDSTSPEASHNGSKLKERRKKERQNERRKKEERKKL